MSLDGRHARFLVLASLEARAATHRHQMGAVIVKSGRVMGKGCSKTGQYHHAEVKALAKNWRSEFEGATAYVVRLRRNQPFGMARPCRGCWQALVDAGVKTVVYSTNDAAYPYRMEVVI